MKNWLHSIKENRTIMDVMSIFVIALFLSIPIFHQNNDIYFDDGSQHLMRAYHTYQSMIQNKSGNVISNFTNGFGYSWNLFYGPLSAWLIMTLGILVTSFNLGFKIAIFLVFFLAGSMMYKFVKEMTTNSNTALLAGIVYFTSPYFCTDIFVRHAFGEAISFIFIPMVFLGLYNLFNTEKNHYYLIFRSKSV